MRRYFLHRENGQALLIAVFLGTFLILSIPIVIYLNSLNAKAQVNAEKRTLAMAVAREGLAYAKQILSTNQTTWDNALAGTFPSAGTFIPCPNGSFTAGTGIVGADGNLFKLRCDRGTATGVGGQPYQVRVTATALENTTQHTPMKTLQAFVSQRTLGVASSEDLRAPVALQMVNPPTGISNLAEAPTALSPNELRVEWGPVMVSTSSLWNLKVPMDQFLYGGTGGTLDPGYPRVFSSSGIAGTAYPRCPSLPCVTSDEKQYWAYESFNFMPPVDINVPAIDTASYVYIAENEVGGAAYSPVTTCAIPLGYTGTCSNTNPAGTVVGHYTITSVGAGTLTSTGTISNNYTAVAGSNIGGTPLNLTPPTIYVDDGAGGQANLTLTNVAIDLAPLTSTLPGALIVNGNLTLGPETGAASTIPGTVRVPPALVAAQEYKAGPANYSWLCKAQAGTDLCNPTVGAGAPGPPNFRGFLWVKGKLIVTGNWVIDGVVLVGDPTTGDGIVKVLTPGAGLTVLYNDKINRAIHVGNVLLQTDVLSEISATVN